MKVALIFGITGQDGSYLSELLLEKGYIVHGVIRRCSSFNTKRIDHIFEHLNLHYGDVLDSSNICKLINKIKPKEIYNLAAQSHVKVSFELPVYTAETTALGTLRILEAIKISNVPNVKFYNASTSELYGCCNDHVQNESTPFNPVSPYAIAKLYSHYITICYRKSYQMFCVNGILFNHESPRRGETFVTRKITKGVANICKNKQDVIVLGDLSTYRDWGHAKDYVRAMYLMLQQDEANDFVISSNEKHTVKEFCEISFSFVGIFLKWKGTGLQEIGVDENDRVLIRKDSKYYRECDVFHLHGDSSKAREVLQWAPTYSFFELIYEMLRYDFEQCSLPIDNFDTCVRRYELYRNAPKA
ncbi:GDP-mannose 4,6-dehydratase, putative [Plasmodium knowlesi strain H]|uniref:GDP-mannose 4,6-dehydratase n=3 Tax=Plasmodium knowlesi TaxID=5850 RepID=A0A5K1TZD2_PLAKH|nr:GDP-mannose 4,6-dehydratase, putative [Plasmodium knowlesi strain H]OTN64152.1 putative GDP-mannose 4 - 6-dehydratase [Plasmodium knowlesi]CAA9990862.1 GDP-mannose 4,6-dehydratase, putative [Plasmodium knowlesi strain H]SBO20917.1 GDP-mannose 4,6-dehydratase, putative [Plasmodium knowlesi strain H]SBO21408.1 GDP-mannose 4,6-dehydratase, putative [Plasmodium knowlesi strain H]VVS80336.1 GDP-mannose 4,6-dehydratase, putative [Plasmodium knowlesi strain H]|eukprot:XP_002262150.1 GDP-mannose 4,6-dehydratase, putative [Plasmodium knowlesi strain H]